MALQLANSTVFRLAEGYQGRGKCNEQVYGRVTVSNRTWMSECMVMLQWATEYG